MDLLINQSVMAWLFVLSIY